MGRSQESFSKKEKEKKRLKKRKEKAEKKAQRKANSKGGGLENMMAYVDEFGNITDTPPDPTKKKVEIDPTTLEISVPRKERRAEDDTLIGRVDFFNDQKGFGFIKERDTQERYFYHIKGCVEEVREGDIVAFELERGMKGWNAVAVRRA